LTVLVSLERGPWGVTRGWLGAWGSQERAGLAQIWLRHVDIVGAVTCSYVGLKCLRRSLRCRWRGTGAGPCLGAPVAEPAR